jgi:solute carrier family 25 protein 34/35
MILNGCRLGFYEPIRRNGARLVFSDKDYQSLGINMFAGASSGILGAFCGSPFFLVKTRLQSFSPFLPVGQQWGYRGAADGLRQIYRAEGVKGLFRGVEAAMIRTGFGSSVQLPTYFFAKRRLIRHVGLEEGPALHLASSTVSGVMVCIFMHPPGGSFSAVINPELMFSNRYRHVSPLQPKRQPLQRRLRLSLQDDPHGRRLCHLQGILRPSRTYSATYHSHIELGGADE